MCFVHTQIIIVMLTASSYVLCIIFFLSNQVEHDNLISVLILSLGMKSKSATIHSKKSSCSGVLIDVVKSVSVS